MKYISEKTNKVYDTVEALEIAEKEYDVKLKEKEEAASKKKERANEVQEAYKEYIEVKKKANEEIQKAEEKYLELRNKFVKDYGSWHMTFTNSDVNDGKYYVSFDSILKDFNDFFNLRF